jgi:hypothetical protein
MNDTNLDPHDLKLRQLLRESRTSPSLAPRFAEGVWRCIERAETRDTTSQGLSWLDAVAGWVLRPRLAFAVAALLVVAGVGLGWRDGAQHVRQQAQARYLAAVAPNPLR